MRCSVSLHSFFPCKDNDYFLFFDQFSCILSKKSYLRIVDNYVNNPSESYSNGSFLSYSLCITR